VKFRQYFGIYTFILCCFVLVIFTMQGKFDNYGESNLKSSDFGKNDSPEESFFKKVNYYLIDSNNPYLQFDSDELSLSTLESKVIAINPTGMVYRLNKSEPIHFSSKNSKVYFNKKELYLENEVVVKLENTELKSDKMNIFLNENLLVAKGNVQSLSNSKETSDQIIITSNDALYRPNEDYFEFSNEVKGSVNRKKQYEESLKFTTDQMQFNGTQSLLELQGNVHIMRENYDAFAVRGSVFLENYNKKLKYYSLSDDVRIEERVKSEGRLFSRKAFSEKLEGFMSERRIILTGLPKVFQDKDVIKGNKIVIRENVETVEVDDANTNIMLKKDEDI
jgi:lipopolysaccharide export system protein LptA